MSPAFPSRACRDADLDSRARREFVMAGLAGLAGLAAGALPAAPLAAQPVRTLSPRAAEAALAGSGAPASAVWAFDGQVPGPELRLRQGERLRVLVENRLEVATTVHFHGIRLPNAMDGVPHLTQPPIPPGGRFEYDFPLPDAGTYWYHPHLGSAEQVGRGLAGALIVEETEPPPVDRDLTWVLGDWRLDREGRIAGDFNNFHDASHAGRIGNTVTVNGTVRDGVAVRAGERLRLRLVNAANARIFALDFRGHAPWLIAQDGHAVVPRRPEGGRVLLGPGMRADLLLDLTGQPGERHPVVDDFYRGQAYRLLDLEYGASSAAGRAGEPLPRLAPNRLPEPDLAAARRHRVVFGGGMMGEMPRGFWNRGMAWTVNGRPVRDHDAAPLLRLARGESQRISLVNETRWPHPIHLHGHVFRVLSVDGRPRPEPEWRDTVLLAPGAEAEIAFVADNPGKWMFHCHVLEHQAAGMMAVVEVA